MRIRRYEYVREQVASYNYPCNKRIADTEDVVNIMNQMFKADKQVKEHFYTVTLNTKMKITGVNLVAVGTLDSAPVHPREVFTSALTTPDTAGLIIVHNHPSGDTTPSREDIKVTERIQKASEILGIKLLDHIIIGDRYTSLKAEGLM